MKLIYIILAALILGNSACKKKEKDPEPQLEKNWRLEIVNSDSASVTIRYLNNLDPLNYLDPHHQDSLDLVIPGLSAGVVDYSKHHGEESYYIIFTYRVLGKASHIRRTNVCFNKSNLLTL